jgi:hypothetical protein
MRAETLVGYLDLMKTADQGARGRRWRRRSMRTSASLDVDQAFEARGRALPRPARAPTIEVDPSDGSLRFSFQVGRRRADIDRHDRAAARAPRELAPNASARGDRVSTSFPGDHHPGQAVPNLMRSVFQAQPRGEPRLPREQAASASSGSSATRTSRSGGAPSSSRSASSRRTRSSRFSGSVRGVRQALGADASARLLDSTGGHPYATQELAYFVWELVANKGEASSQTWRRVSAASYARSTTTCPLWDDAPRPQRLLMLALADEPCAPSTRPTTPRGTTCPGPRPSSGP